SLIPVLLKMGRVLRKRKLFEDALDHYRRALQIVESRLQIENPYASAILQQIGMAYYGQNKLDLARRYVYRTLEMTERAFGAEHPYLGMILNNVGLTHFHTDNGDTALKYFFWASEIRTKAVGADDFTVGTIYGNIARVYQTQGKYNEAQMCLRKTLDIYRSKLAKDHPYIQNVQESLLVVEEALAADG
ncbi:MAG: tetratricopeptide repeat protein, partial [Calditrichaeota bacterium]|nr:tetratricopeptide repeat protein [Calditrichota bacterium]